LFFVFLKLFKKIKKYVFPKKKLTFHNQFFLVEPFFLELDYYPTSIVFLLTNELLFAKIKTKIYSQVFLKSGLSFTENRITMGESNVKRITILAIRNCTKRTANVALAIVRKAFASVREFSYISEFLNVYSRTLY
jgi:hypothetical protein